MIKANLKPLTSLRFVAAFIVLCHHYVRFEAGYVGVTFFFILSGFILAYNYAGTEWTAQSRYGFWWRRVARIYPTHLLTLAAALPIAAYGLTRGGISIQAVAERSGLFVVNALLLQSWVPAKAVYFSFNSVSWSISTEAFFYAVFPFLLSRWENRSAGYLAGKIAVWTALLIAFAFVWSHFFPGVAMLHTPTHFMFYINPVFRLYEFAIGICLGLHFLRNRGVAAIGLRWELFAVVLAAVTLWAASVPAIPAAFALSFVAIPASAVVVAVFARSSGPLSQALCNRWMVLLGEASFALYMIHGLISIYVGAVLGRGLLLAAICTLIAIPLSVAIYIWVEKPAQRFLLSRMGRKRIFSLS